MLKRVKITILFLALLSLSVSAEERPSIAEVAKNAVSRITTQLKTFPQEKIYLHLDKPYYAAGDRIWFRAHMIHAALGLPYELSRYIYVELIDKNSAVVLREKIRPIDGMYYGQLSLSPDLLEGWYSIRAYTNFMRNVDESFFYRRSIYIGNNLHEQEKAKKDTYTKQATSVESSPFLLNVFPEGEHLIPGNLQLVGIRASKADGTPVAVTGKLVDANNTEVATFNTNLGLGMVHLMPEAGQHYTAIGKDEKGNQVTLQLPPLSADNYSLAVMQSKTAIQVTLNTPEVNLPSDTLLLLVLQRGAPLYQEFFTAEKKDVTLSKKGMAEGLLQFLLIDRGYNILSERQIFIQEQEKVKVTVTTDKPSYRIREHVSATVLLTDTAGKPIKGNFSVSVTDDDGVSYNENDETIESRLMLQSEISDKLFQPNYFLNSKNKQAVSDLDILMVTSPWKRYNLTSVLKGHLDKGDHFPLERGSSLSGQVVSYPSKRGLPNNHVSLFIQNPNHIDAKNTDKNGRFYFDGFEFPDSSKIMLEAKMSASNFIRILIDNDTFPEVKLPDPVPSGIELKSTLKTFMDRSRQRYLQENGGKTINLKEVEVIAQKQEQEKLQRFRLERGVLYFNPTYSIKQDRLETANTLIDVLMTIPGISVSADGKSVLMNDRTPMIMVDNIKRDMNELNILTPADVELIDIVKDPADLAVYGINGANGVIFLHLKRGEAITRSKEPEANQAVAQPLGYCVPLTFPEPNYLRSEIRLNGLPDLRSTLYWKPNVVCDANGKATINFFLGDGQSACTLTIEGVTPEGKIIRYQGKINAKK